MATERVWKSAAMHDMPDIGRRLLPILILYLLREPVCGYEIQKQLTGILGGDISCGVINPWLSTFEKTGLTESELVARTEYTFQTKRLYHLTETGKQCLLAYLTDLKKYSALMQANTEDSWTRFHVSRCSRI